MKQSNFKMQNSLSLRESPYLYMRRFSLGSIKTILFLVASEINKTSYQIIDEQLGFLLNNQNMFFQQGQFQKSNVSQQAQLFVDQNIQHINQIFVSNYSGYRVVDQYLQQLGGNGTNHILHIVGLPNGNNFTITVHVPSNNGMPIIIESRPGVITNFQHGYGQQYGNQGYNMGQNPGFNISFGQSGHGHHGHHEHHGHHGHGHGHHGHGHH